MPNAWLSCEPALIRRVDPNGASFRRGGAACWHKPKGELHCFFIRQRGTTAALCKKPNSSPLKPEASVWRPLAFAEISPSALPAMLPAPLFCQVENQLDDAGKLFTGLEGANFSSPGQNAPGYCGKKVSSPEAVSHSCRLDRPFRTPA